MNLCKNFKVLDLLISNLLNIRKTIIFCKTKFNICEPLIEKFLHAKQVVLKSTNHYISLRSKVQMNLQTKNTYIYCGKHHLYTYTYTCINKHARKHTLKMYFMYNYMYTYIHLNAIDSFAFHCVKYLSCSAQSSL